MIRKKLKHILEDGSFGSAFSGDPSLVLYAGPLNDDGKGAVSSLSFDGGDAFVVVLVFRFAVDTPLKHVLPILLCRASTYHLSSGFAPIDPDPSSSLDLSALSFHLQMYQNLYEGW